MLFERPLPYWLYRGPPQSLRDDPRPRWDAARQRHPVPPVLDPVTACNHSHRPLDRPHGRTPDLHLPPAAGVPNGRPADGLTRGTSFDRP